MVAVNLALLPHAAAARRRKTTPLVSILIPARDEEPRIARAVEIGAGQSRRRSRGGGDGRPLHRPHGRDRAGDRGPGPPGARRDRARAARRAGPASSMPVTRWPPSRAARSCCSSMPTSSSRRTAWRARSVFSRTPAPIWSAAFRARSPERSMERLVIPLIHFVLLGYLPVPAMRRSTNEAYAAGCGQLFLARREAYERAGGHASIRATFHDGLQLPRSFRRAGLEDRSVRRDAGRDLSHVSQRRGGDSRSGQERPRGHGRQTGDLDLERAAARRLRASARAGRDRAGGGLPAPSGGGSPSRPPRSRSRPRLALAMRFRQSIVGALLHPLGVALLVAIQWYSWFLRRAGRGVAWKDRVQADG